MNVHQLAFFVVMATFICACVALAWKPKTFGGEIGRGILIAMVGLGFYLTVLGRFLG